MGLIDNLAKAAGGAVKSFRDARGDEEEDDLVGDGGLGGGGSEDGGPDVPSEAMIEALKNAGLAEPTEEKPRALFHDPYSVMDWGGWREKPSALTYETLRTMSQKNTAIAAIVQIRTDQVAAFGKPQQGRYDKGYRIVLRDRRDSKRSMSTQESIQAAMMERMIESTGVLAPKEKPSERDSFRDFLRKAVRDILIYDQFCFEKIRDRRGKVSQIIVLPAETIRPAVADVEHMDPAEMRNRVSHVQIYEDTVIAEFSPDDIAWCTKNVRSDLRANSFGFSPVEQLTNLVTAWLFGFEYNQRFFTQGSGVKGVLNIKGAIPDRQLKAFRRLWYSMVSGVNNAWRTPVLNSEDLQWVSMHANNREMEFSAWMDFLQKLTCAVFGIDPTEINFIYGNSGQKSSLNQSRPNAEEVMESKDKGLRPLMDHIEDCLNRHVIWELNPDFEFSFEGFDAKAESKQREAWDSESKAYKTVDEVRAEQDLDPMPDGLGQVVRDSVWLQNKQADQGQDEGDGEEEEDDGKPLSELPGDDIDDDDQDDDDDFGDEEAGDDENDENDEGGDENQDSGDNPFAQPDKAVKSMDAAYEELESLLFTEPLRKSRVTKKLKGDKQIIDIVFGGK